MRLSPLHLVLAGLLGSAGLTPAAALAYPNAGPRFSYGTYGPPSSPAYAPLPVNPYGFRGGYGIGDNDDSDDNYDNDYSNDSNDRDDNDDNYGSLDRGDNNPDGDFYANGYGYPIASEPAPYGPSPLRRCNPGTVLTGAAIGGGLGALLAPNSRNRLWSLPIGAAMGGILGGVVSGC